MAQSVNYCLVPLFTLLCQDRLSAAMSKFKSYVSKNNLYLQSAVSITRRLVELSKQHETSMQLAGSKTVGYIAISKCSAFNYGLKNQAIIFHVSTEFTRNFSKSWSK